jgi:hypothetical protein
MELALDQVLLPLLSQNSYYIPSDAYLEVICVGEIRAGQPRGACRVSLCFASSLVIDS